MAFNVAQSFHRTGPIPIDDSQVLTKAEMLAYADGDMPDVYFAVCKDDGNLYIYNKTNEVDSVTGKFRAVNLQNESNTSIKQIDVDTALSDLSENPVQNKVITSAISTIQQALQAETNALLADKADKATTYTKAETDSLVEGEHIELTQAQYTALPEEEKNNGKVYFITDGGAYVPAVDLIPYGNQAPIVVGKLDLRGDGEFRDIKRVRLWINDLKNAREIITAGWVETGVYVRPIRVYGWFTFHDYENTATGWRYIIQQFPIPYHGYQPKEAPSGEKIGLKFYVDHNNKLNMIVDGKSYFNQDDFACVIVDFIETPVA